MVKKENSKKIEVVDVVDFIGFILVILIFVGIITPSLSFYPTNDSSLVIKPFQVSFSYKTETREVKKEITKEEWAEMLRKFEEGAQNEELRKELRSMMELELEKH